MRFFRTLSINTNIPIIWVVATALSLMGGIYYAGKHEIVEKLTDQNSKSEEIKQLKEEIEQLKEDIDSLEKSGKYVEQLSAEATQHKQKITEYEELQKDYKSQLSTLNTKFDALNEKYKSLGEESKRLLADQVDEINNLKDELRNKDALIKVQSSSITDFRIKLSESISRGNERGDTIDRLLEERNQDCRFNRLTGTESTSWSIEWNFDSGTHRGTHPGGGSKTSDIDSSCSLRFLAVRQTNSSDGNNCTYFGTISGSRVAGTYHCSGVQGNLPFSGTLTRD